IAQRFHFHDRLPALWGGPITQTASRNRGSELTSALEAKQVRIRMVAPANRVPDDLGGEYAERDPVSTVAEREVAARPVGMCPDIRQTVLRFSEGSRPRKSRPDVRTGKQLFRPRDEPFRLGREQAVPTLRIAKRFILAPDDNPVVGRRPQIEVRACTLPDEALVFAPRVAR